MMSVSLCHTFMSVCNIVGAWSQAKDSQAQRKAKVRLARHGKLLGRTESEEQGQPDPSQDPEAVKGLGYAP